MGLFCVNYGKEKTPESHVSCAKENLRLWESHTKYASEPGSYNYLIDQFAIPQLLEATGSNPSIHFENFRLKELLGKITFIAKTDKDPLGYGFSIAKLIEEFDRLSKVANSPTTEEYENGAVNAISKTN